jgi:4a-hydroxytetrahydrobiopterin dehydratase
MTDLVHRHCAACNKDTPRVQGSELESSLRQIPGFALSTDEKVISRRFTFKNFADTMAFVNAVAFIAHREDHHPDLEVSYGACRVSFTTHDAGGITENDLICAAKVTALLD